MMDTFCRVLYILIALVYASEGQQSNTTEYFQKPEAINVPFCGNETEMQNIIVPYFDSNETHIYSKKRNISTNFTRVDNKCPSKGYEPFGFEHGFEDAYVIGFTYNSSLIYVYNKMLIPPANYCWLNSHYYRICFPKEMHTAEFTIIAIYLSCLSISTLCYFGSAIIYYFILKVQDDHKKCFVGFSLSMGVTFTVLIILQVVGPWCDFLGSLFFMFLLSSFVWLTALCVDLNLMIRHYREDSEKNYFYLYISLAILFPCCVTLIALLIGSMGLHDVPFFFVKQYNPDVVQCIKDKSLPIFFIPTGLLVLLSTALLCHSCYLIWLNEKQYKNDFNWLEKRSEFKYTLGSCSLLILPTAIWIIDMSIRYYCVLVNEYVLDCIEASQGIFAVVIFVFNRYTRRKILYALYKNEEHQPLRPRWQDLVKRFEDDTVSNGDK